MLVRIFNGLMDLVENLGETLLLLLPDSPFNFSIDVPEWASWVGIFIPFGSMAAFMTTYVTAVLAYYLIRIALRWLKAVGS
jgi:hypothetical protein